MKTHNLLPGALSLLALPAFFSCSSKQADRPNIVLIMVDDMGYSDLGCFGGEIPTPNIDRLAENGIRYTQFYSTARSCPTRASLLTGLYAQQAGIGMMTESRWENGKGDEDKGVHGYRGFLNRNCVTMGEVLGEADYHTYMIGKWHLGKFGEEKWPLQRGFDRFYGILEGACSYLQPHGDRGLMLDNTPLDPPAAPYYTTDAFTDYALEFIDSRQDDNPFFLYLAYNAPHWPLQAKTEDIERFKGRYDEGWEAIQQSRHQRMVEMGIIDESWGIAEWESRSWSDLTPEEQANSSLRMAVYTAQIYCVDYNVGRILSYLEEKGELDNTLFVFLSDNGACAEPYSETGFGTVDMINDPGRWVQPSYGLPWAQVSNTPFRKYKVRAYEGGLSVPLIFSWPAKYGQYNKELRRNVAFLPDLMATFIDVAGATYPEYYHDGQAIIPLQGTSLRPSITNPEIELHDAIYGEHFDNRFVRQGRWKAVKDERKQEWELFDIEADRSERNNLAGEQPERLAKLVEMWDKWAAESYVYPKQLKN